ncbi:MAG: hypothetical protein ABIQ40_12055 [Bacteroidia bacterium]
MESSTFITEFIANEAEGMLIRIKQLKPFSMTVSMVKSAAVSDRAFKGVNDHVNNAKRKLRISVVAFIRKLRHKKLEEQIDPVALQNQFAMLKLRFNSILDQLDIYADVLTQRSEQETGTWLRGLDILAEDGLSPGKKYFELPALMVYLDRGHGAAIRRARTRLPGGDLNPVAVIQIPRERMCGNGIGSSLVHEVGHQAAELIGLTQRLKEETHKVGEQKTKNKKAWEYFERWVSEIVADFWAIAQLGISATQGLMGVVSLPAYFQFRLDLNDPHPAPFVRVLLSCRSGNMLFPDPQWQQLEQLWNTFYPTENLPEHKRQDLHELLEEMPEFIRLMINLRLKALNNQRLVEIFPIAERQPNLLRKYYMEIKKNRSILKRIPPTLLFAIVGQAKADFKLCAKSESRLIQYQLTNWANHLLN